MPASSHTQAIQPPLLETERLTLRAPEPADLQAYAAFYAASEDTEGMYRGGRSEAEVAAIHTNNMLQWQTKGFGIWLLCRKEDSNVLGGAGLEHEDDWNMREITWWLMPSARGHGYAQEACRAIIAHAYDALGWSEVEAFVRDDNHPSHRLAQALGGTVARREEFPDGIIRNIYALPREVQI